MARRIVNAQQSTPKLRRKKKRGPSLFDQGNGIVLPFMVVGVILCLAVIGLLYEFYANSEAGLRKVGSTSLLRNGAAAANNAALSAQMGEHPPSPPVAKKGVVTVKDHPLPPLMPIFSTVPDSESVIQETMNGKPSLAGVLAIMQKFIFDLHMTNRRLSASKAKPPEIIQTVFDLTDSQLGSFDKVYRDKLIFPVREDESIFLSLAAYREHLLNDTMAFAFDNALYPEKLFVGAVVQNCFGKVLDDGVSIDTTGLPCKSGVEVVGEHHPNGVGDKTKVYDRPPDPNGIASFCAVARYKKYCENGQVRVLYIHETEALGPAVARYFASKLWGGETYFLQCDSHLMFADHWDEKYRDEIKATRNYPKSILSSYPPGFQQEHNNRVSESAGARLCVCSTRPDDPNPIVRINVGRGYAGDEPRPTQIPFVAAGFFFTRAEFLRDVPFDPFMPWLFMGEEIALSMRAWTHGWDIYAPRKNLIAHQYRPGYMGLPKFWGTVNRMFRGAANNNVLQKPVIKRVKNMVGYPDATLEKIKQEDIELVLKDIEHYGLGSERSWSEYMEFAHMSIDEEHDAIKCTRNEWCNKGLKD